MNALHGKSVLVTGAGRGIGRAYATLAAAEGAAVIVNDIDTDVADQVAAEIRDAGGRAVAHPADVADWDQSHELIQRCVHEFSTIDGLVNNAGVFSLAHAHEQDPAELARIIDVNVLGTAYCGIHAMRAMLASGGGSIVNVTSGAHAGMDAMSAYSASKGAVASLTYTWALELADRGIRVNAISPIARTRMSEAMLDFRGYDQAERTTLRSYMPDPATNAPAVVYLLSDESRGVNGQIVRVDRTGLSLVTHPMILEPTLDAAHSVPAVAEAFDTRLTAKQAPLGLVAADVTLLTGAMDRAGSVPARQA